MPVQRVGISIGEGPAQTFDFPEISKAIDFGRQRKLMYEKDALIRQRQKDAENRQRIDDLLGQLSDSPYWIENPHYSKEVESRVKGTVNAIYDNAPAVAAGDLEATRKVTLMANETRNYAERSAKYKEQYVAALEMMKEYPDKYSEEQKEKIFRIGNGDLRIEEVQKEDPYWYWGDKVDLEAMRRDFTQAYPNLVEETVMSMRPVARNLRLAYRPGLSQTSPLKQGPALEEIALKGLGN